MGCWRPQCCALATATAAAFSKYIAAQALAERLRALFVQMAVQPLLLCSSGELGRKRNAVDAVASMAAMLIITAW